MRVAYCNTFGGGGVFQIETVYEVRLLEGENAR